jgi:hypothetical protein
MLQRLLPPRRRADRQRALALTTLAAATLALGGCGRSPVEWDDARERRAVLPPGPAGVPDSAAADQALRGAVRLAAGAPTDSASPAVPAAPPAPRPARPGVRGVGAGGGRERRRALRRVVVAR